MIFVIICDDTHATSESIVYVFGIGDLLGRKVGQVTTHAQLKWRNCQLVHRKVIVFLGPL